LITIFFLPPPPPPLPLPLLEEPRIIVVDDSLRRLFDASSAMVTCRTSTPMRDTVLNNKGLRF
jgi:hypothetical protein